MGIPWPSEAGCHPLQAGTSCLKIMRFNLVVGGFSISSGSTEVCDGVTHSRIERQLACQLLPSVIFFPKKASEVDKCDPSPLLGRQQVFPGVAQNSWVSPPGGGWDGLSRIMRFLSHS